VRGMTLDLVLRRRCALALPLLLQARMMTPPAFAVRPYAEPRFLVNLPDGFAVSKRKATSGTIFVAGNFPRAAVVSVSIWPLVALVDEDIKATSLPGIAAASPRSVPNNVRTLEELQKAVPGDGSLENFARLLLRKRDREANSPQSLLRGCRLEDGGQRLLWSTSTEFPVADAEELYRLKGVRALVRIASAATVLGHIPLANGERVLALFTYSGSALETDWQADLGQPIETSIASFAITSEML